MASYFVKNSNFKAFFWKKFYISVKKNIDCKFLFVSFLCNLRMYIYISDPEVISSSQIVDNIIQHTKNYAESFFTMEILLSMSVDL